MNILDEKWHANEESGRIYDERGSCVADLCAPEAKRAAHLRFFMRTQEAFRLLEEKRFDPCERGRTDCAGYEAFMRKNDAAYTVEKCWPCRVEEALRAAGVLEGECQTPPASCPGRSTE